jgi:hypothetical protein
MSRSSSAFLTAFLCIASHLSAAQHSKPTESDRLRVELHSATGSNRFHLGEAIPLVLIVSSTAKNQYLEPCRLFWKGCFGFPQCRFVTRWSLDITPKTGWAKIDPHECEAVSGPLYKVETKDLTDEQKEYPFVLTDKFRFDAPGKYTVRLTISVGIDDKTNQFSDGSSGSAVKPSFVSKDSKILLEIVPTESQ